MQAAQIILSALPHSCTGGLASLAEGALAAVMLAFTAPILMLILIPTKWSSLSVEVITCEC